MPFMMNFMVIQAIEGKARTILYIYIRWRADWLQISAPSLDSGIASSSGFPTLFIFLIVLSLLIAVGLPGWE